MSTANQTSGGANYQNSSSANNFKDIKLNQTSAINTEEQASKPRTIADFREKYWVDDYGIPPYISDNEKFHEENLPESCREIIQYIKAMRSSGYGISTPYYAYFNDIQSLRIMMYPLYGDRTLIEAWLIRQHDNFYHRLNNDLRMVYAYGIPRIMNIDFSSKEELDAEEDC